MPRLPSARTARDACAKVPKNIVDFAPGGTPITRFFFIEDPDGYKIEVLQRGGRFK